MIRFVILLTINRLVYQFLFSMIQFGQWYCRHDIVDFRNTSDIVMIDSQQYSGLLRHTWHWESISTAVIVIRIQHIPSAQ